MCGIAGCIGVNDTQTVNRMLDALPHRGPNDRGVHILENAVFGHTRLSIVDVAHGHQPILANGGTSGIVCNGEIYNFEDLKKDLIPKNSVRDKLRHRSHFAPLSRRRPGMCQKAQRDVRFCDFR